MFNFLNPTFVLIGAGAILVPILIHLLLRNKTVRIDFAAMRFLMESRKPVVRWLRLKQLLILLLRIAAVALLALAFARPFLPEGSSLALWRSSEREIGIIVDVSASLGAGSHVRKARERLSALFDRFEPETAISVYFTGGASRLVAEREPYSPGLKARVLASLQPTYQHGTLREAIQYMDELLRGSALYRRELYVISDFQRTAWPQGTFLQLDSHARVFLEPLAERSWKNFAVIAGKAPETADQPWRCTIRAFAGGELPEVTVNLVIGERVRAGRKVAFRDANTQIVEFDGVNVQDSDLSGYFEVDAPEDAFAADDRYYFATRGDEAVKILAVNGESEPGASDELYFAERAINAKGSPYKMLASTAIQGGQLNADAFSTVILANVRGLSSRPLQELKEFVERGGGLLIAPGDRTDNALYNRFFDELAPAQLLAPARPRIDRSTGEILLMSSSGHPALLKLADPLNGDLSSARFYQYWQVEKKPAAEVLAAFGNGEPAILGSTSGRGKVILLTFPLDSEWSDLPVQSSYLPLLHTLLGYLQPTKDRARSLHVGQPIYLGDVFEPGAPIQIEKPDGHSEQLQSDGLIYNGLLQPGLYTFRQRGRVRRVAVNLPPEESESEIWNETAFLAMLDTGTEMTSIDRPDQAPGLPERAAEANQKWWRLLLIATLVVLVGESALANRTPR